MSYGKLADVVHQVIEGKSYLNLIGMGTDDVFTVVLVNRSEEALSELKVSVGG